MKAVKDSVNPRGRGPYNDACDVCARKKIKCGGLKPVCQPCQSQGRQKECTWTKNLGRKPVSESHIEAYRKQVENLLKTVGDFRRYADSLESRLDECQQYHHPNIDFRANRPPDPDVLPGQEDDSDFMMGDDNDQDSDDGNDPNVMAICIPPQSLQVEPFKLPSRFPALAENPDDTYVLDVDGAQLSRCNSTLDWSRHLPKLPRLLDRPSHDKALDLLFKFFTSWCLRIVPALFLRDMYRALSIPPSQTPPKTPHYSPMLHNALVALALAFLDELSFRDLKTRQCYADTAKSFIEAECRRPNLSVVQALSVLSSFHSSNGDQTLGYMYFGMSARMSQALGLNVVDCSEWVRLGIMDEAERVDRHWASWTNSTQDVCWSLYVGRDFCVAEPIGAKATPMPCIDPELDEMPWFYPPAKIAPQPNNLSKTFKATCGLLMIARRIMDVNNGLNKARGRQLVVSDAMISGIDVQLNNWNSSLTDELKITSKSQDTATPHKLMLHLAYWWLFILLHRPFFQRKSRPIHSTDREIDHVKLCRRAAENIVELLSTWRNLYTLRYCPVTLIQTAFSAGTVFLLIARQASSGTRIAQKDLRHSLHQENLVHQYLQEIGYSWKCATNISVTLRNLENEQVRPLLELIRLDPKTPTTAGLHIPADIGDEEENDSRRSRSSSRKRSAITNAPPQIPLPHTISSSGSDQSSLSTSTSPTQVPPSAISPTITISSTSSTHAAAPTATHSLRSTFSSNPFGFTDSWAIPGSSPNFDYLQSSAHPDCRRYAQPFSNSNYMDDLFSSNGNSSDVGHAFGSLGSSSTLDFQPLSGPSSENHYVDGYLGMLGGQPLSEAPFVGVLSEVEDTPNFLQAPFGTGPRNHEASSSSLGDNDNMDLDSASGFII